MASSFLSTLCFSIQGLWGKKSPRVQRATLRRRKSLLILESLERRNLMVGDLGGTIFNDLNTNGLNDTTDPGLSGWTVFVDTNNDGRLTPGEPNSVSDTKGKYTILGLPAGNVTVYEVPQAGFAPAVGFSDHQLVNIRDGRIVKWDFPNVAAPITVGNVNGTLFEDDNFNGSKDPGEHGLEAWTVFIDSNNDGLLTAGETSTITDADGDYQFVDVLTGVQNIVEVPKPGYAPISTGLFPLDGAATSHSVTVIAGGSVRTDFANALTPVGTIQGHVWNDTNGDGVHQATETAMSGRPVFVDLNSNGTQDADEPLRITDATGAYSIVNIRSGSYRIVEQMPAGYVAAIGHPSTQNIIVSGGSLITLDFHNLIPTIGSIRGTIFNDVNSDGRLTAPEPGLAGWQVYVDLNNNGTLDATDLSATTDVLGSYSIDNVPYATVTIREITHAGYTVTSPSSITTLLLNGENRSGVNFGNHEPLDFGFSGAVYHDANKNGVRDPGERGLSGVTIFIDSNLNGVLDTGEASIASSADLFYTPAVDESGTYSFSHLARGTYHVVEIAPAILSGTPAAAREQTITIGPDSPTNIDFANQFRANEIHGVVFDDTNENHSYDSHEYARPGVSVYIDMNRNDLYDEGEPTTTTGDDGSYAFLDLTPGAYVVRERHGSGAGPHTYPTTGGGTLWPTGNSNPSVGNVTPGSITTTLEQGQIFTQTIGITLPGTGTLTNLVDVFLLFDDTGSFTSNSPIVRAAFPTIINSLQTSLPGIDLGFGVGRLEEYGSFAGENSSGRPFILNQPIVASSSAGFLASIQSALDRMAPGFGGDQPETDIEALYQLVTGRGFDGNANGSVLDSGRAGLASTQINPGISGDVPSFASFVADTANGVMPAAGNLGGGGFRAGALPIVLLATDTGFAYQPKGETSIIGAGGLTLPVTDLIQVSRGTTPFSSGAGIQETITGLNALGALVIGLGTNAIATTDPRRDLEAISKLTGAINQSTTTIANGTADPVAPGDPLYFQIGTGFGSTVADGVINAIQNAVTNVAMDITVRASDPRVHLVNRTGTVRGIGAGQSASFDIEIVGEGRPRRFDIEFVREGTGVVLGSIPVVIGVPIPGDNYSYDELEDGEIHHSSHFGDYVANVAPTFVAGSDVAILEDAGAQSISAWATSISPGPTTEARQSVNFLVSNSNSALFSNAPSISPTGTLTFTPAANAFGQAIVVVTLRDNGGTGRSGADTSAPQTFTISVASVNDAPVAGNDAYDALSNADFVVGPNGLLANDTDVDGDALNATLSVAPLHGSVVIQLDGSFVYTPNTNFAGFDSFVYSVSDGSLAATGTVTLKVTGVNSAPVALDDNYSINEDNTLSSAAPGVLSNDSDLDANPLTAVLVNGPTHGTLTLNANGSFTYVPNANFNGSDSFVYRANDGLANSNLATVLITVNSVNDAPVASPDAFSTAEDTPLVVSAPGLLGNDTDIDSVTLQSVLASNPLHGTLSLGSNGGFTYTPAPNYSGPDSFSYRVSDGSLQSNIATVNLTVTPVNDTPIANNDSYSTLQNTLLQIAARGVLLNDSDADGDVLTSTVVTGPSNGTLTLGADGAVRYVPNAGFSGTDSFKYRASDATTSAIATVNLTVIAVLPPTKFFVADIDRATTFKYAADGTPTSNFALSRTGNKPHGIASNASGTLLWVLDESSNVLVYDNNGGLLGQWQAQNIGKPEGITVWGNDLWIVDQGQDRVHRFVGGASLRSGRVSPTSNFALNTANANAMDLVTDGTKLWVVNDIVGADRVFRYNLSGVLEGSWTISTTNPSPTGITIDPNSVNHIWIVDASTDRVYQYSGATALTSGSLEPSVSFALAATNTNAQGIADPKDLGNSGSVSTNDYASHNYVFPHDVNDDGSLTPIDALSVINRLNDVVIPNGTTVYHDVNDDSQVTPLDALSLINAINRQQKSSGNDASSTQASSVQNATSAVRARVEMETAGPETELKIRIDHAPTSASFPVTINDIALGQLFTDSRGRGEIKLGVGDDNRDRIPLPQGLDVLSPDMELVIGDILRGKLTQVARLESTATPSPQVLRLIATFDVISNVRRIATYEQEVENGVTKRKLDAEIENAQPNSRYEVFVADVSVGQLETDSRGKGKLRLTTLPKDARDVLMPTTFPTIAAGTAVRIGSVGSTLQ